MLLRTLPRLLARRPLMHHESRDCNFIRRFRSLHIGVFKIRIRQRDELALFVFVAFDDVRPIDFFSRILVDAVVTDGGEVTTIEHMQGQRVVPRCSMQLHRHTIAPFHKARAIVIPLSYLCVATWDTLN